MRGWKTWGLLLGAVLALAAGVWVAKLVWLRPFSIDHFFERAYIQMLWDEPEALSASGILERYRIDRHRGRLDNDSEEHFRNQQRIYHRNLRLLEGYDRASLSAGQQVHYDVLHWHLSILIASEPFFFHSFPVTHIAGPHIELPQAFASSPLQSDKDINHYLDVLACLPGRFEQLAVVMTEASRRGLSHPAHIIAKAAGFCHDFAATPPEENIIYTSFKDKILANGAVPSERAGQLMAECLRKVQGQVIPAYQQLGGLLTELAARAPATGGAWQLPDGHDYYRYCLQRHTSLMLEPEELYAQATTELGRIQGEMLTIFGRLGLDAAKGIPALMEELLADTALTFHGEDAETGCAAYFEAVARETVSLLPQYFMRLPTAPLLVETMPQYRVKTSNISFYLPPAAPGTGREEGRAVLNTARCRSLLKPVAQVFAFHEGLPGHHMQLGLHKGMDRMPQFRQHLQFSAFAEGWAMYAEELGLEMTGRQGDLDRLGLLWSDLLRTAKMMADLGLHYKRWIPEDAITFMMRSTGISREDATSEVDRYLTTPGQGCAHKVGKMEFMRIRRRAMEELGTAFDIREFHDMVLGQGTIPLHVLEARAIRWIDERRSAAQAVEQ